MRKLITFLCLIVVFTILFGILPQKNLVLAKNEKQQTNPNCANLDVVFIIDQSWAMSAPGTTEASDPLEQRKYAVDAMIDLLTGLALDQCPGSHHRIGVISYGTTARVDLNLYDINPATAEEANTLRDPNGIKKQVVADNLGESNPLLAFDAALNMFRTAPNLEDALRKKVIIFFTGSIPHDAQKISSQVNSKFPFDPDLLMLENCTEGYKNRKQVEDLPQDIIDACRKIFPVVDSAYKESIYLWTISLQPFERQKYQQAYSNMIEQYDQMSREHGGKVIELTPNSIKDVPTIFRRILSITAAVTPFTIAIAYPPHDQTIKNVHLITFDRWPPLDIVPLPIRIRLLDRDGNMIAKPEDYLKSTQDVFTAHIESADQTSEEIKLQPDPNNPGYFTGEIQNFEAVGAEQKVVVSMDESAMLKDTRPYNLEVQSSFIRADDLLHTSAFWQFILALTIIMIPMSLYLRYANRNLRQKAPVLLANMVSGYSTMGDLVLFPAQLPWSPDELNRMRKDVGVMANGLAPISDIAKEVLEEQNPFTQRMLLLEAKKLSESLRETIVNKFDIQKRKLWLPVVSHWNNIFEGEWQILEKSIAGGLIENPYEVGNPLRVERKVLFRGRTELRDAIIAALRDKNHFTMILSGQRRMGKTSLLLQLPALLPPDTIPVFIDLQKPANTTSDSAFLYAIALAIYQNLKNKQIEARPLSRSALFQNAFEIFDNWLDEDVLPAIGSSIILLAFDEFEKVGQALSIGRLSDRALDELRHTIQHRQQIAILFAGVQTLDELGPKWSSYFLNVRSFSIGYLSHEEAESLIVNPDPESKFPLVYTEDALQHIVEITHCHPFLVQLVCSCVVERVNAKQPLQFNVDLEIVKEAENLAMERGEPYFRNVWDEMATPDSQPLLKKIALTDFLPYKDLDTNSQKAMHRLLRYRVVVKQEEGYIVEVPLVKRWIVERSPVE